MTAPELKPCPFCGGKAEFVRKGTPRYSTYVRCTDCGCGLESNENFDHGATWNTRADTADAAVAAAYEQAAREIETRLQVISDTWHNLFVHAGYDAFANRLKAMTDTLVKDIPPFIRALATDEQTDALEQVRKEAALKALADMGQEWDADTAAAQVAAAYERAADSIESRQKGYWESDWVRGNNSAVTACAAHIRALATDTQADALEQVRRQVAAEVWETVASLAESNTPTYGIALIAKGNAASLRSGSPLDNPTPDPDEQTEAQELALRKAVSS